MPGRLVMDVKEPQGLAGQKRDGSHLSQQSEGPEQKRVASDAFRAKLNGVASQSEGAGNAVLEQPTTNGGSQHAGHGHQQTQKSLTGDQPQNGDVPELENISDALIPFGKIIERMAQQTYFDLSEAVEMLADMRISQAAPLPNGLGGQAALDKSPESVDKKLRLLNFAQTHKDRFIKALVLSDWARNMDDMTKLIEVSMFMRKQDMSTHVAADSIYRLKDNMIAAKMPNPNIEGALELLTTGEAPWMPDLGYIPPEPLSAHELLDTLSDMDFALSVRLNLHQDLPPNFQKYTIANGRATFTVEGEFEVDLAVVDDDPESPFYFIDLRLLFSPTTSVNSDRLRNQLEGRANEILASSGLKGCYDFLHNFVLTHKLNVLRCQALELARGKWIDHIKVEGVHRNVVVQYWKNQIGGKNWIELGITSGGSTGGAKRPPTPRITCRWFRRGQEVSDHDISLDLTSLSMNDILEQVVAKHASGRLAALSSALQDLARGSSYVTQHLNTSSSDAIDCSLSLASSDYTMAISTDPVRGAFCVQPQSKAGRDLERKLNNDVLADGAALTRYNYCRDQLNNVELYARAVGLSQCSVTTYRGSASSVLREAIIYISFQRPSWGSQRALTVTCDLINGMSWYLAKIGATKDGQGIEQLWPLGLDNDNSHVIDTETLLRIERTALVTASLISSAAELADMHVKTSRSPLVDSLIEGSSHGDAGWPQYFNPNQLSQIGAAKSSMTSIFQSAGACSMEFPLDDSDEEGLIYRFRTALRPDIAPKTIALLHKSLKHDTDLQIGKKGEVQIRWCAQLGAKVYSKLRSKLDAVSTLCSHVETLAKVHCAVLDLQLDNVKISYEPGLTCRVSSSSATQAVTLEFGVDKDSPPHVENPHTRIRKQLEILFVRSNPGSSIAAMPTAKLADLVHVLRATLPILRSAAEFEKKDPMASVTLHCHTAIDFRLVYREPLRGTTFSISGKPREGKLQWVIKPSIVSGWSDQNRQQLAEILRSTGTNWEGAKTRALVKIGGIADCLNRFDTLIRGLSDGSAPVKPQVPQQATQQAQRIPGQQQQLQRPPTQQSQQNVPRGHPTKAPQKARGQEVVVLD
ncbi:Mediator complex subunit MED14-like protein [Elsinoe fawcettii]|nr:Mediator complex subunit MED14-like protein [Elsinoe fawcettii]